MNPNRDLACGAQEYLRTRLHDRIETLIRQIRERTVAAAYIATMRIIHRRAERTRVPIDGGIRDVAARDIIHHLHTEEDIHAFPLRDCRHKDNHASISAALTEHKGGAEISRERARHDLEVNGDWIRDRDVEGVGSRLGVVLRTNKGTHTTLEHTPRANSPPQLWCRRRTQ